MSDILVPMPNGGFKRVRSAKDRLADKLDKTSETGCWVWTGMLNHRGYGLIRDRGKMRLTHQLALELSGNPRPEAPRNQALHGDTCASRACCNPSHLRWGTNRDNVADRERLGRNRVPHVFGARHGSAKLDDERVLAIRNTTGKQCDIAALFGVCPTTVGLIKRRKTWRHLP